MVRARAFAQVDVFSAQPYRGNPVAVFLDGDDISDDDMQAIARWTNLSATTFVCPPTTPDADYRLRIVTARGELPFAGHPSLGSAHAWLERGGTPRDGAMIVQECGAGLVSIRRSEHGLSFAAPPTVRDGEIDDVDLDRFVAALRIDRGQVVAHQWIDNGPGWAVLRLASAQEVLDLEPDLSLIPEGMVGVIGAHPEGSDAAFEMRTFAPGIGVAEDPVCGSMNASVGQWLTRSGAVTGGYTVTQGSRLGRSGLIVIEPDATGAIWVGGATTTLFSGTARV